MSRLSPQQAAERDAWQAQLLAAWNARRCCHRGCRQPVTTVVIGRDATRGPGGILITRKVVDRNYCARHAPGLQCETVRAS
jgi:hypothetical protein